VSIARVFFLLACPRSLGFIEVSGAAQFVAAQPVGTSPSWALAEMERSGNRGETVRKMRGYNESEENEREV